jgi:hypothetical protein
MSLNGGISRASLWMNGEETGTRKVKSGSELVTMHKELQGLRREFQIAEARRLTKRTDMFGSSDPRKDESWWRPATQPSTSRRTLAMCVSRLMKTPDFFSFSPVSRHASEVPKGDDLGSIARVAGLNDEPNI